MKLKSKSGSFLKTHEVVSHVEEEDSESEILCFEEESQKSTSDRDDFKFRIMDEESSHKPKKLERIESKNFSYEIINLDQAKILYISKMVMLKNKFDYCCFPDGLFKDILSKNQYLVERASQFIRDREDQMIGEPEHMLVEIDQSKKYTCNILWEEVSGSHIAHFGCGHVVDKDCMKEYLEDQIYRNGEDCVNTSCPNEECKFFCSHLLIEEICDKKAQEVYYKHLLSHFCKKAPYILPCLGLDCNLFYSIPENVLDSSLKAPQQNALCECGWSTCLRCGLRGHQPLNCELNQEWVYQMESLLSSLNNNWLKSNTKKCPNCKTDIQKNQGCMHMTCKVCKHGFCWLCLADWKLHNTDTGGFFNCNRYNPDNEKLKEEHDAERLQFYMDRYIEHDKSYRLAQKQYVQWTQKVKTQNESAEKIKNLGHHFTYYLDCLKTLLTSRNFVTFTYSLGYKIKNKKELDLFSINQYMLEYPLENFDKFLKEIDPNSLIEVKENESFLKSDFLEKKDKALSLKINLENQLENAKKEFGSKEFLLRISKSDQVSKQSENKKLQSPISKKPLNSKKKKADGGSNSKNWCCTECTYYNENNNSKICSMCEMIGKPTQ